MRLLGPINLNTSKEKNQSCKGPHLKRLATKLCEDDVVGDSFVALNGAR